MPAPLELRLPEIRIEDMPSMDDEITCEIPSHRSGLRECSVEVTHHLAGCAGSFLICELWAKEADEHIAAGELCHYCLKSLSKCLTIRPV